MKTLSHRIKLNWRLLFVISAASFFMSKNADAQNKSDPKRYALLVAVTKYNHSEMNKPVPLRYPEVDAKAVGKLLEKHGYEVDYLLGTKATQSAITAKLKTLSDKGNSDGVCLVGFWGHGVEFSGSNESMFCPFDTKVKLVADSLGRPIPTADGKDDLEPDPETLVGMGLVFRRMKTCPAGNRFLIADCCRNDPNQARGRSFGANVKISDLPDNMAAIFGCKAGEQAFEHEDWGHGAFSKALLDLLPNLVSDQDTAITSLLSPLKKEVKKLVGEKSNGRSRQTIAPIINGIPDLKLLALKSALAKRIKNSVGMEFSLIPRGTFMMGSPASEAVYDNEIEHEVTLSSDYYMGIYEVTQGQWKSVMGSEPWLEDGKPRAFVKVGADYPATYISWEDAVSYCKKLSVKEGQFYRLPTEAEWERACRGGTVTAFSFGNTASNLEDYGWFEGNAEDIGEDYAHRVGMKKANGFGLHDMHGNVSEYCSDWYGKDYYSNSPSTDPRGPASGSSRVHRGGCWRLTPQSCRSANRSGNSPDNRHYYLGFRVVRSSE